MTGIDLDAIQARADAATAGEWTNVPWGAQNENGDYTGGEVFDGHGEYLVHDVSDADGEFIAHARTDIPALIAAVRERDATIARVRAVVDDWIDGRYGDDGYRVAPQPDDGHVLDHLRAAIDVEIGQ